MEFVFRKDDMKRMKEYHHLSSFAPSSAPRTYEFQFVDLDENIKDVILNTAAMPGVKQIMSSSLDITDRKKMEVNLQ
jgi:hypothetical protein